MVIFYLLNKYLLYIASIINLIKISHNLYEILINLIIHFIIMSNLQKYLI